MLTVLVDAAHFGRVGEGLGGKIIMCKSEIVSNQKLPAADTDSGVNTTLECPVNPLHLENIPKAPKS